MMLVGVTVGLAGRQRRAGIGRTRRGRTRQSAPGGRRAATAEALVVDAVRRHLQGDGADPKPLPKTDRELVERYLPRVMLSAKEVTVHLRADSATNEPADGQEDAMFAGAAFTSEITIAVPPGYGWPAVEAGGAICRAARWACNFFHLPRAAVAIVAIGGLALGSTGG
jgi:hypothetical protein